jgi:hypothetical protein
MFGTGSANGDKAFENGGQSAIARSTRMRASVGGCVLKRAEAFMVKLRRGLMM